MKHFCTFPKHSIATIWHHLASFNISFVNSLAQFQGHAVWRSRCGRRPLWCLAHCCVAGVAGWRCYGLNGAQLNDGHTMIRRYLKVKVRDLIQSSVGVIVQGPKISIPSFFFLLIFTFMKNQEEKVYHHSSYISLKGTCVCWYYPRSGDIVYRERKIPFLLSLNKCCKAFEPR